MEARFLNKYNRTENTLRNSIYGLIFKTLNIVGAFVTKTLLIYILGIEFAGLDGLFGSVLKLLNMADMGFSTAVVYKLYKPIAEGDDVKVRSLLLLYRRIYRIVGLVILVFGVLFLPFLPHLVFGETPSSINLQILFLIYLINASFSYFVFSYKTAVLSATQRNDLISKIYSLAYILRYILQIVFLLCFKNYYTFIVVIPLTTILSNIGIALVAKKHFPQYYCSGTVCQDDKTEIRGKITSLMFNKFGTAIINGSDNIVISAFLGLTVLGIYDSYFYIFSMLFSIFDIFHQAVTGGIGNSVVTESVEKNYTLYKKISFLNYWVVTWVSTTLFVLYLPFMKLWIGAENTFDAFFSGLMALYFYCYMIRFVTLIYKNALGMWKEDRFRAFAEAGLNLSLNLLLVNYIGIYGITLSTIVAMLVVSFPWETIVLFKKYFNRKANAYFLTMFIGLVVSLCVCCATYCLALLIPFEGIAGLALRFALCLLVPNAILFICFHRSPLFRFLLDTISLISKKRQK